MSRKDQILRDLNLKVTEFLFLNKATIALSLEAKEITREDMIKVVSDEIRQTKFAILRSDNQLQDVKMFKSHNNDQ